MVVFGSFSQAFFLIRVLVLVFWIAFGPPVRLAVRPYFDQVGPSHVLRNPSSSYYGSALRFFVGTCVPPVRPGSLGGLRLFISLIPFAVSGARHSARHCPSCCRLQYNDLDLSDQSPVGLREVVSGSAPAMWDKKVFAACPNVPVSLTAKGITFPYVAIFASLLF